MRNVALNTEYDGPCRTIKAQYCKNSMANFIRTDSFGASGVLVSRKVGQISSQKIITKGSKPMEGTVEKDGKVYAIRKLTPLECWRLMGFSDEDFRKAEAVNSNTQLYKQAGNSIAKDVLMAIFSQMIEQPKGR